MINTTVNQFEPIVSIIEYTTFHLLINSILVYLRLMILCSALMCFPTLVYSTCSSSSYLTG